MKRFIEWSVKNEPAVNTVMISVLILGLVSTFMLRREAFPEFKLEIVLVSVPYPGASPDEVEQGICQKIEEAVRTIDGIKKVTAVAKEGNGSIIIELNVDVEDPQRVLNEVRSAVDRIPSFPEQAEDPQIQQITMRSPAIRIGVVGGKGETLADEIKLRELTEQIREELLQLPSISQVELAAAKEYQIDVEIPEESLRKYNLSLRAVADILRRQNLELPAGNIRTETGEFLVRGKNKSSAGVDIAKIPVVTQPDGVVLTVGDLGTVRDGFNDETTISEIDGRPGLVLTVQKTAREDILLICDEVHQYVRERPMPEGYSLKAWGDRSTEVRQRISLLTRNGLGGLMLVFLMLAAFLELRLSFWVAMGIPFSILGTCLVMLYLGQTLNMLSMFAFVMALGIVVDDAIVVGENIYSHRLMGKSKVQAAIDGAVEVAPSVVSSVLTTVIAFIPLFYVSGVMGKFISVMPLAIIATLLISLFEATFMLPCHLAHGGETRSGPVHWIQQRISRGLDRFLDRIYRPSLRWSLDYPATIYAGAVGMLLLSVGLILGGFTPFIVFPRVDSSNLRAVVMYPAGTPASVTNEATRRIEQAALDLEEELAANGTPVLLVSQRTVGYVSGEGDFRNDTGGQVGQVYLELLPTESRSISSEEVVRLWRQRSGEFPGAEELSFGAQSFGPGAKPVEFKLLSSDIGQLEAAVEEAKAFLASYPGVFDVSDDSQPGKWEQQLKIKREAEALGMTQADLAQTVRAAYYGEEVMRLQRGRHEVKLMVRYPEDERRSFANFEEIRVRTPAGDEIPLGELAQINVEQGYTEINRVDQIRSITVTADIDEARANAREIVADLKAGFMPTLFEKYPRLRVRWEGQQEQTDESVSSLFLGFLVAVFAMYALLVIEFKSYLQPIIILVAIPFGLVGAIFGHLVMGLVLTLFSLFGAVALAGIVVNDSIVMVDTINQRRRDGFSLREALLDAGPRRFRPIMLTSITTIGGLMPIVFEPDVQAQILVPMAVSISFGLLWTTILVLFLAPVMYQTWARIFDARHSADSAAIEPALLDESEVVPATT